MTQREGGSEGGVRQNRGEVENDGWIEGAEMKRWA